MKNNETPNTYGCALMILAFFGGFALIIWAGRC